MIHRLRECALIDADTPTEASETAHSALLIIDDERASELRRGGYLVDFWGAGFDVAERMGIVPELRRRGYVMAEARAVDRDGRRVASLKPSAIMGRRSAT